LEVKKKLHIELCISEKLFIHDQEVSGDIFNTI
jgi:hypothetical protein